MRGIFGEKHRAQRSDQGQPAAAQRKQETGRTVSQSSHGIANRVKPPLTQAQRPARKVTVVAVTAAAVAAMVAVAIMAAAATTVK